jgi:hypothetical protein
MTYFCRKFGNPDSGSGSGGPALKQIRILFLIGLGGWGVGWGSGVGASYPYYVLNVKGHFNWEPRLGSFDPL